MKMKEQEQLARLSQAAAKRGGGGSGGGVGGDASLLAGGGNAALRAQIEAEDELLAQISNNVSRIGAVSREMTTELRKQDKQLDELNKSVDKVTEKVVQNSKAAKKLTK
jgi:methyl-accepting chemotaxis protein